MPIKGYVSSTHLSKNAAATLNSIESGETDKLIILKNNSPKAILLSFESYEAIEKKIEGLRLTAIALFRILTFDPDQTSSHAERWHKYVYTNI